jgi:hypothetical protein
MAHRWDAVTSVGTGRRRSKLAPHRVDGPPGGEAELEPAVRRLDFASRRVPTKRKGTQSIVTWAGGTPGGLPAHPHRVHASRRVPGWWGARRGPDADRRRAERRKDGRRAPRGDHPEPTGAIGRRGEAAACSVGRQALAFRRSRHKLCRSLGSIVLCRRCFCRCSGQLDVEDDLGENVQQQIEQIRHCGTDQTQASWGEQKDDRKDRPSEEDVAAYPL